jgi:hypothetical protein
VCAAALQLVAPSHKLDEHELVWLDPVSDLTLTLHTHTPYTGYSASHT